MCEKRGGVCTGRSRLRWQRAPDEYTMECPRALLEGAMAALVLADRWTLFGNPVSHAPYGVGWYEQPGRWWSIIETVEREKRSRGKDAG